MDIIVTTPKSEMAHAAQEAADCMTATAREIVVDLFAGAGGASCGIRAATGRDPDIAVDHNPLAIEIHRLNHPDTEHLTCDVFEVDPLAATRGRPVGLLWASPDCTHFSRAKGGRPVEKRLRSLAWVVVRWASKVRPRLILLENVPEFRTWGPLGPDNRPLAAKKGQTFRRWSDQLRRLGYEVEFRELVAADYGTPTTRKRLFMVARCDGEHIRWPLPTHANRAHIARAKATCTAIQTNRQEFLSEELAPVSCAIASAGCSQCQGCAGRLRPWRSAAECIDWSRPCPSIFDRKRPLAEATLRRIAKGLERFVFNSTEPFMVVWNHGGTEFRGQSPAEPMPTLCASRDAHGLVVPTPAQVGYGEREGQAPRALDIESPLGTVVGGGNKHALVAAFLQKYFGGVVGADLREPTPTVTAVDHNSLVTAFVQAIDNKSNLAGHTPADSPVATITQENRFAARAAHLQRYYGQSIGSDGREPLPALPGQNHDAICTAYLTKLSGTCRHGQDVRQPMPAVTAGGYHIAEVRAFLIKYFGSGGQWGDPREPLATVTSRHRLGLVTIWGIDWQIVDIGLRMLDWDELLAAQFGRFAAGYKLLGSKSRRIAAIGNSVPPEVAELLVRANYVEPAAMITLTGGKVVLVHEDVEAVAKRLQEAR